MALGGVLQACQDLVRRSIEQDRCFKGAICAPLNKPRLFKREEQYTSLCLLNVCQVGECIRIAEEGIISEAYCRGKDPVCLKQGLAIGLKHLRIWHTLMCDKAGGALCLCVRKQD